MVTNSTLRGLAGALGVALGLALGLGAEAAAVLALGVAATGAGAGGSVLEQAAARHSTGTNERRMGCPLLLGLDLSFQTIELTF